MAIDINKKYTPKEVSQMFEVTVPAVYKWMKANKLKSHKRVGRHYINGSDLKDFAEANNLDK